MFTIMVRARNGWFGNVIDSRKNCNTYLRLKSGDAQRIATLGICGTNLIIIATWFRQSFDKASLCASDGVFFGGARSNDARLSETGLQRKTNFSSSNDQQSWQIIKALRWINNVEQSCYTMVTYWPCLRHYSWTLTQYTTSFHKAEQTNGPWITGLSRSLKEI